jgi:hypothetical protein
MYVSIIEGAFLPTDSRMGGRIWVDVLVLISRKEFDEKTLLEKAGYSPMGATTMRGPLPILKSETSLARGVLAGGGSSAHTAVLYV